MAKLFSPIDTNQVLTAKGAAELLGMTPRNFFYLVAEGGPPVHLIGLRKFYLAEEVMVWAKTLNLQPGKGRKKKCD